MTDIYRGQRLALKGLSNRMRMLMTLSKQELGLPIVVVGFDRDMGFPRFDFMHMHSQSDEAHQFVWDYLHICLRSCTIGASVASSVQGFDYQRWNVIIFSTSFINKGEPCQHHDIEPRFPIYFEEDVHA